MSSSVTSRRLRVMSLLLGTIVLIVLAYAGYLLVTVAIGRVKTLNSNILAALIAALAGLTGVLYTQWQSKKRDILENHRAEKARLYKQLMDLTARVFVGGKDATSPTEDDAEFWSAFKKEFVSFTSELIIWASPEVIRRFLMWRTASTAGNTQEVLFAFDDLLQSIRVDLRNGNKGLGRGDLLRLYLSNPADLGGTIASSTVAAAGGDDNVELFVTKFGKPDSQYSSESETPRPPFVTRSLVYGNVRVVYLADTPPGAPPPYHQWKLIGFQNASTSEPLPVDEAVKLIESRT